MTTAARELRFITRQLRSLLAFRAQQEAFMAEVDQAVSELVAAVDGVAARVQEDVDGLLAEIAALKDTSAADKASLTAAVEGIRGQVGRLQGIDPIAPVVEPEPTPDPEPEPTPESPAEPTEPPA